MRGFIAILLALIPFCANALTSQQISELAFNLDQQAMLMATQKIEDLKLNETEQKKFSSIRDIIEKNKTQLNKTTDGKHLLSTMRRMELAQSMSQKLSGCAKGQAGKDALKNTLGQVLKDDDLCVGLLNDNNFSNILNGLKSPLADQLKKGQDSISQYKSKLLVENLLQASQRFAELQYLFKDFTGQSQDLIESICGDPKVCENLAKSAGYNSVANLKSKLQEAMNLRKKELADSKAPRQTQGEFAEFIKCQVVGCAQVKGMLSVIKSDYTPDSSIGLPGVPLDGLKFGVSTSLALRPKPASLDSNQQLMATSEERLERAAEVTQWFEHAELQGQSLISKNTNALFSHPAVQLLGGDPQFRKSLCLPSCEFSVFQDVNGKIFGQYQSSEGVRLDSIVAVSGISNHPERLVKQSIQRIRQHLTDGLKNIVKDVANADSPEKSELALAQLVAGNPLAAARMVIFDPQSLGALCLAIKNIPDKNPWKETLIAVGGIGASILGGVIAGPVGLTIAAAVVAVGSAGYSAYEGVQMSKLSHHYEVACASQSSLSVSSCGEYNRSVDEAQGYFLSAATVLLFVGTGSQFKAAATSARDLAQAMADAKSLRQALNFVKASDKLIGNIKVGLPEQISRQLEQGLSQVPYAAKKAVLEELGEARRFLKPQKFEELVQRALAKGCTGTIK